MWKIRGLYAIADAGIIPESQLIESVTQALTGGAKLVQYRNKIHPQQEVTVRQLANLCQKFAVPLIINDNVELALKIGAAGVHLGQGDMTLENARQILGENALIGISCHNDLTLARRAQQFGASYIALGSFFPSRTKPHAPPAPLELITLAKRHLSIPLVAIGGITTENAALLIHFGADAIAVIRGLFSQPDIRSTAAQFALLFDQQ